MAPRHGFPHRLKPRFQFSSPLRRTRRTRQARSLSFEQLPSDLLSGLAPLFLFLVVFWWFLGRFQWFISMRNIIFSRFCWHFPLVRHLLEPRSSAAPPGTAAPPPCAAPRAARGVAAAAGRCSGRWSPRRLLRKRDRDPKCEEKSGEKKGPHNQNHISFGKKCDLGKKILGGPKSRKGSYC